ncbi:hypothetical protein [Microbacterium thalassium]|uniref:Uncharacterized protein n=1 Tax=Microbacterium thalassium TaxID=362649 RepID=A0A7X0KTS4_9MICO|nr:hypothetical protein [Microbacterium thalassium]MBB6390407.1 hypothetical protein [Microbacterium thalassium]GLK25516.1 hypothetical protein GCM10017607_28350 [Microbacterium thalassium]
MDQPSAKTGAQRVRRRSLALDLTLIGVVFVVLAGALWATVGALYSNLYSPSAFVSRYVGLLADGRAADALAVPGVAVDSVDLEAAGLPQTASDALLRQAALGPITDVEIVSESTDEESGITTVTVSYRASGYPGTTTFSVEQDGWIGPAPTWRFARSPLAVMDLTVGGSMTFDVNGFTIDKRQVSVDGVEADPAASLPLLVFTPGIYSVSVDTSISSSSGVAVLSDSPFRDIPVSIQARATEQFVSVVQERVTEFLDGCATQEVLQPTSCPFGYVLQDRVVSLPSWSITLHPTVEVVPSGADWSIPGAEAVAKLEVDVQSLFDGTVYHLSEEVPFTVTGKITVLGDGSVSIAVGGP